MLLNFKKMHALNSLKNFSLLPSFSPDFKQFNHDFSYCVGFSGTSLEGWGRTAVNSYPEYTVTQSYLSVHLYQHPKTACANVITREVKKKEIPGPILDLLNKNLQGLRTRNFVLSQGNSDMQLSVAVTATWYPLAQSPYGTNMFNEHLLLNHGKMGRPLVNVSMSSWMDINSDAI